MVAWAESKDFRGCPLQHTVSELTDAARAVAPGQREWFADRLLECARAAGAKDANATARALVVLFDGAVAGSEMDGPQRASDARWMARSCWPAERPQRSSLLQSEVRFEDPLDRDVELHCTAVEERSVGLAFMSEDRAAPHLASGALVRVLDDCCRPFPASSSYHEWAVAAGRLETVRR